MALTSYGRLKPRGQNGQKAVSYLTPFLVRIMCPFAVAVPGGKCLDINFLFMPGKVSSSSGWLRNKRYTVFFGGDPRDW